MPNTLLKVENVKKSFKIGNSSIEILKGISFEVNQGDFAIIFGPSGSGKSTLLHVILGLEIPSEGDVKFLGESFYQGKDEDDRSAVRKKHIGMVYQQPNWIKSLNVVENVAFPLILLGVEKAESVKQAWKQLETINLQKWVSYIPTELSGGQQQRVALARALITNPSVIIADEPTGNLDFQAGQDLMNLLMKLNGQGRTIIMVTHDLEYLKYAKRAIQILDGKVVAMFDESSKEQMMSKIMGKRGIEAVIGDKAVSEITTMPQATNSTATNTTSGFDVTNSLSTAPNTQPAPTEQPQTNPNAETPVNTPVQPAQTTTAVVETPQEQSKPVETPTEIKYSETPIPEQTIPLQSIQTITQLSDTNPQENTKPNATKKPRSIPQFFKGTKS